MTSLICSFVCCSFIKGRDVRTYVNLIRNICQYRIG